MVISVKDEKTVGRLILKFAIIRRFFCLNSCPTKYSGCIT